jgi:hypothetical protein
LLGSCPEPRIIVFVAGIFALGLICAILRHDYSSEPVQASTASLAARLERAGADSVAG